MLTPAVHEKDVGGSLRSCIEITVISHFIIWQGKSERSDWFFLGRDFAIRIVSVETVISCVFFVFESRQIQNKHDPSAIYRGYYTVARRCEFYVRVARTISHSFAALTREILFLPRELKIHIFEPPCNVLFIIWRLNKRNTRNQFNKSKP